MELTARPKSSPKDVFLHLLAIITLYVSAGGFIALLFQYINILFPDQLNSYDSYRISSAYSTIRWAIASLIILFPAYIGVSWFLQKEYVNNPLKRELRVRRWLIYFTLFAAGLIIMGDLVSLIYWFLSGELTARFILKIATVLIVAGVVFGYYLWDTRDRF